MKSNSTYQLPPEWALQSAIMLTWPHEHHHWVDTLATIDTTFVAIAAAIATQQKLIITCYDQHHKKHIEYLLKQAQVDLTKVLFGIAPCDDIWVRDHGPITILDEQGNPILLDFTFNGWGNKYPSEADNNITQSLYQQNMFATHPLEKIPLVLEGGALEVDGKGTLLTTSRCLLAKNRNPHLSKKELALELKKYLGINRILWLDHGYLSGDDTDSHIDTLARFIDPYTICYVQCLDPNDEHYAALKAMEEQLQTFTNYQDNPYRLIPLPMPKACYADFDQRRLPATYANFLICNKAVLVPTYNDTADTVAIQTLAACFPDREMIPIPSLPIIQWYGSIHCMTMQLPQRVI